MTFTQKELIERTIKQVIKIKKKKDKFKICPPRMMYKNTKTIINNFNDICISLQRIEEEDIKHFVKFLEGRMKKKISIDGSNRLLISGRRSSSVFMNDLLKYDELFLKCGSCGSHDTSIKKERRLTFIECSKCKGNTHVNMDSIE